MALQILTPLFDGLLMAAIFSFLCASIVDFVVGTNVLALRLARQ
jgi:hypothetical protein